MTILVNTSQNPRQCIGVNMCQLVVVHLLIPWSCLQGAVCLLRMTQHESVPRSLVFPTSCCRQGDRLTFWIRVPVAFCLQIHGPQESGSLFTKHGHTHRQRYMSALCQRYQNMCVPFGRRREVCGCAFVAGRAACQ